MPARPPLRWTLRRIPTAVAALIAATALVSIVAAVGSRNGAAALLEGGLLIVPALFAGQLWRLVTWVLYEMEPVSLLFACLTLYWVGGDLARTWGTRRFVGFYFGLAALAATVTALVGRFAWPAVAQIVHGGSWPVLDGALVAWGLAFADRRIHLFGVLPLTGRHLVGLTLAVTALYALFFGLAPFVPHVTAELAVLAALGPGRRALIARRKERQARAARGEAWSFDDWFERERRRRG